jgi:deoxyribose-phosphate aldolase
MGVKASGGIRTLDDVKTMAAAGASRIGASASVKIVESSKTGKQEPVGAGY